MRAKYTLIPVLGEEAASISINRCRPSSLSYGMNPSIIASTFLRVKGVITTSTLDLGRRVKSQGQKMPGASVARCILCGLGLLSAGAASRAQQIVS